MARIELDDYIVKDINAVTYEVGTTKFKDYDGVSAEDLDLAHKQYVLRIAYYSYLKGADRTAKLINILENRK